MELGIWLSRNFRVQRVCVELGHVLIKGLPRWALSWFKFPNCESMIARYDLTDFEWSVFQPLLPKKPRGVPRVDDRRALNGIFRVLRIGAPWRDLAGALWAVYDPPQPLQPLAQGGRVE